MKLLLLGLLISTQAFAQMNLNCLVRLNNEEVSRPSLRLNAGDRNIFLEQIDGLRLLVTLEARNTVELQLYNPEVPSRSYTSGELHTAGQSVQLILWERERLLEVKCQRL